MRVVFFGTPAFAVPSLEALAASRHSVVGVVTQPDRPRGRGQKVTAAPVKAAAARLRIPVLQPARLIDDGLMQDLRSLSPDLGVVAAYGKILPTRLIGLPRLGMINVHASLLPRWRGAAPIHRAVLAGDRVTGVTIMRVVTALDAGPMIRAEETAIAPDETSEELESRLAVIGASLLIQTVDALEAGPVTEVAQDEALAVYARRLDRRDSQVDFSQPAWAVHNAIRGLHPWPLAAASLNGKRVLLLEAEALPDESASAAPGTIVRVETDALAVSTGHGLVRLRRVQLEGRAAVSIRDFLNGHRVNAGDRFMPWPAAGA